MPDLEDDVPQPVVGEVAAVEQRQVQGVVGLPRHREADVEALLDLADLLVSRAGEQVLQQQLVFGNPRSENVGLENVRSENVGSVGSENVGIESPLLSDQCPEGLNYS